MGLIDLSASQIANIAKRDTNRLVGSVAKCLAANSPFINVLRGGTFASGQGDTVTSAVEMQAAPGDALALPTFTNFTAIQGTVGKADNTGKVTYTFSLQAKRGIGPKVAVQQGYGAFKSSYITAEDAMRKLVTQYINADIQANLAIASATKFVAKTGQSLVQDLTGGSETDIGCQFTVGGSAVAPDGVLTFKALHAIARHAKEALFAEMFPSDGKVQPHFKFIGSADIVEAFRNELSNGAGSPLVALTSGGYKLGEEGISGYSFETSPAYRGIAFGVTQRPLRALRFATAADVSAADAGNALYADGTSGATDSTLHVLPKLDGTHDTKCIVVVDPVTIVTDGTNHTAYAKKNDSYLDPTKSLWEVGFLVADGTFERQVPEKYAGEGSFKFAPQLHMGELEWHYVKDNADNSWGDFGWHKYQITRAYKPLRPQHVIPILYKRTQTADLGLGTP